MTRAIAVSQADLADLKSKLHLVHLLESKLEYMSEGVRSEFAQIKEAVYKLFEEDKRIEELVFNAKNEYFERIRRDNNFTLVWSDYSVDIDGINACFGNVSALTYEGETIIVNNPHAQFLDVWRAADTLLNQQIYHIYLEGFHPSKDDPTVFEVILGS